MVRNKPEIFLGASCGVAILLAAIMFMEIFPGFNATIKGMSVAMGEFGRHHGLIAAFLLSIFGNTTVFIVVPYSYIIWIVAVDAGISGLFDAWYPLLLGVISGLGAGVGEVTSYAIGRLFAKSKKLSESPTGQKFERMRRTFEQHPRSIPFIIYLFAVTPLPDDAILVPFGVMKYSYWKTIIPCMLGKMTLCTVLALFGFYFGQAIEGVSWLGWLVPSPDANPGEDMLALIPLFLIVYLMIRADFEKLMNRKKKAVPAAPVDGEPVATGPAAGAPGTPPATGTGGTSQPPS